MKVILLSALCLTPIVLLAVIVSVTVCTADYISKNKAKKQQAIQSLEKQEVSAILVEKRKSSIQAAHHYESTDNQV
jgi:hypothetical protein